MITVVRDTAVAVQVPDVIGSDAHIVERDIGAFDQVTVCRLEEADPCTALFKLVRRSLPDRDVVTCIAQQTSRGQPTE